MDKIKSVTDKVNTREAIGLLQEKKSELECYAYIIDNVRKVDLTSDGEFQKCFNGFYKVRLGGDNVVNYYKLFEKFRREEKTSFDVILKELYEKIKQVSPVRSSKMLATLEPDMPIWDKNVMERLGLKVGSSKYIEKRLRKNEEVYQKIVDWYAEFMQTPEAKDWISEFDKAFPEYTSFSDVKKIDFILWVR